MRGPGPWRALLLVPLLWLAACGLADDERDAENKHIYIENRFSDSRFREFCLAHYDLNGDGGVSRYEAQRILDMDCAGLGIASLNGIEEFTRLQRLDCSGNALASLDLRACTSLRRLNCSDNELTMLDIGRLAMLATLDCDGNRLPVLLLPAAGSLVSVSCVGNDLPTLDVSHCALVMDRVDVRGNSRLGVLYVGALQRISDLQFDGPTVVERL